MAVGVFFSLFEGCIDVREPVFNAPLVSECETCKCSNRVRPGGYMIKADIRYGGEVIANADKKIILS